MTQINEIWPANLTEDDKRLHSSTEVLHRDRRPENNTDRRETSAMREKETRNSCFRKNTTKNTSMLLTHTLRVQTNVDKI